MAGCDSTITTNLTVIPNTSSTANISICDGQSYTPPGGSAQTTSGTYVTHISNAAGCDSTITTNLTVIPNTSSTANISICDGQSYTPPGGSAQTTSGTYATHVSNAAGCDSTITTNLTVIPNTSSTANISICDGQSYTPPGGSAQTTSGTYVTHISNAAGCDSTITTNLTVIPNTSSTANISICDGQSYTPPGGSAQTTSGTYVTHISNAAGCDSTITTNLTVIPNTSSTANISICDGQSYTPPGGSAQTTSGTYVTHISNAAGCDSTITTNLTVIPNTSSIANISICNGQSYTPPGGVAQEAAGTYVTHIPNAAGCDSTITTILTLKLNTSSSANVAICNGQSYTPPGGTPLTISGNYITHISNAVGCDSAITTHLTVIPNSSATDNISICNGQNYTPPGGSAQTTSGTYITHIPNAAGCDSTITTNLTVIPNSSSTANITICNGNSYTPPGGPAETSSGIYITHIPNAAGCDSTITTNLSVISVINITQNLNVCLGNSVTLPDGSTIYPVSDTSCTHTFPSISVPGCDSIVTTNIVVNPLPVISATANQITCFGSSGTVVLTTSGGTPSYTYSGSPTTNLPAGTYLYIVTDSKGCRDSITAIINPGPPSLLSITATPSQIRCAGMRGSVALSATGGVGPYIFSGSATTNLIAGTYNYTVTDALGCTANATVVINPEPPQLVHTATATQIACYGGRGSVVLSTTGGTPPYFFSGSPTTNLSPGTYNYSVTDSKGCVTTAFALIAAAPARITAVTSATATKCNANTGTVSVNISGGSAPYSVSWNSSPVQTTPQATGLGVGTYWVSIVDGHGCTASASATVAKATSTPITITGKNVWCPGESTALCATSGLVSYQWNNGDSTRCSNAVTSGTFTVIATNLNGCTSTASKVLTSGTTPVVAITGNDYYCPGTSVSMCATPGLATYTWNNNLKAQCRTVNAPGTYWVTATNASGCSASATQVIKAPLSLSSSHINGVCSNGFLGDASVNASGDTGPYTFLWNTGDSTQHISNLNAGTYIVTATDSYGCTATSAQTVAITKTTQDYSNINSSFMNYTINAGTYIWFSAVANIVYSGSYPVTINFTNQNITSSKFNLSPANAKLILTNSVSQATTEFNGTEWVTTSPPNISGQYFISGYSHLVPLAITPNLNPVAWKGIWTASCPGVASVQWKWTAAVYSSLNSNPDLLGVKPIDGIAPNPYFNSDLAGTPENYTANLIAGARSTGGTVYTGSYSGVTSRTPCAPLTCTNPPAGPQARIISETLKSPGYPFYNETKITYNAFPNPFSSVVNIEIERKKNSCNTIVEIYDSKGQKVKTLFDDFTEENIKYNLEFNGEGLIPGIYICKIISGEDVINGKLILSK